MKYQVPFVDLGAMAREVVPAIHTTWDKIIGSCQFIGGEVVEQFEHSWASYCGAAHAVGVASGTDALQLALIALGVGVGDEVVVPTNTFVASAEAVVLTGATPRFADVDPDTLLLSPETLVAAITSRTKAVIVVHLYGQMADMDGICRIADAAGLAVVEDAAQAHGATWRGRRAGSIGQAGCFSFYPGKNLGAFGDAGAVVTSDPSLAERIRILRDHGRTPGSHYQHELIGVNSRLDALQAAVLEAKLARLDSWNEARRTIATRYQEAFEYGPVRMVTEAPEARGVHHLAVARVPHRDWVARQLAAMGVQTSVHYPVPCHLQGPYRRFATRPLPVAEHTAGELLSLPMFPHMTEDQVASVCKALQEVLNPGRSRDG